MMGETQEASSDYALGEGPKTPKERAAEAANYVKTTAHSIAEMGEGGPLPLRVFAFLGGILMIVASIVDAARGMWHVDLIHILISIYVCAFGALICILEGGQFLPSWIASVQGSLHDNARFLRFMWGRGCLFFFAGSLQFSHWSMLNCVVGMIMMVLGVTSVLVGKKAASKLGYLRKGKCYVQMIVVKRRFADFFLTFDATRILMHVFIFRKLLL